MRFNITEELKKELALLHTEISEVTYHSGSFTDTKGVTRETGCSFIRLALVSRPSDRSYIRHEVWLPEDWNGIFLGMGNSGMAGNISHGSLSKRIGQRYVVANTDMGTSQGRGCGFNNPEIIKDFGWRSTWLMTKVGKLITETYYGKKIEKSYFYGASTGGQQSLMLAQRYPEEYDGITVGVPANNRVNLHISSLWIHNAFIKGNVRFEQSQFSEITRCAAEYGKIVGASDPEDMFVSRPRGDKEYVDGFLDYLRAHLEWITEAHISVLDKIYSGPVDPRTGDRIFSGFPIGAESMAGGLLSKQNAQEPRYTFAWVFGEDYTGEDFDFASDADRMREVLSADLNANDPDLRPFFSRGGKLFIYAATADPVNPFPDTMKYYDRVVNTVGVDEALKSSRFFLIPGQNHAASVTKYRKAVMNDEFEMTTTLDIIRKWCEDGVAPDSFDIITRIKEYDIPKRLYPYCTENNPSRDYPACSEKFM